jgi:hypothetical protein
MYEAIVAAFIAAALALSGGSATTPQGINGGGPAATPNGVNGGGPA